MFSGFTAIESLNLSNFNTSQTINLEIFYDYLSLTSLDLSKFNTSNVVSMISMFEGCSNLTYMN